MHFLDLFIAALLLRVECRLCRFLSIFRASSPYAAGEFRDSPVKQASRVPPDISLRVPSPIHFPPSPFYGWGRMPSYRPRRASQPISGGLRRRTSNATLLRIPPRVKDFFVPPSMFRTRRIIGGWPRYAPAIPSSLRDRRLRNSRGQKPSSGSGVSESSQSPRTFAGSTWSRQRRYVSPLMTSPGTFGGRSIGFARRSIRRRRGSLETLAGIVFSRLPGSHSSSR
jgi:hypothetical protein